ncbi:MAG TPA: CGNR zinc finger domain-containing protein [Gaiella sp.]|nr:CGNR zinc finger domain-containing protein [Gaiella sp.]
MADPVQPGGRAPAPLPLDLVQDFVNTEVPDWNRDDISTPEALGAWLRGRGLIRAGDEVDSEAFVAARALRSALRELARANTVGEPPTEARRGAIDAALGAFPLVVRVDADGPGVAPAGAGATRGLAAIVAVVAAARAAGTWERLKACRQETCGWLFYDVSRNRSSSWCSMQICGGREKARAYRRRRAGAGD